MKFKPVASFSAMAGLLLAAPAMAQDSETDSELPGPDDSNLTAEERLIIVQAARERRERVVQEFAEQITRRPRVDKPLERWREPICVTVYGIKAQFGDVIKRRFLENLDVAGLKANDDPECRPNVLIGVVADVDAEVRKLEKDQKEVFGSLLSYQIDRTTEEDGPVRSWNTTEVLSDRGLALDDNPSGEFGGVPTNRNTTATRLNNQVSVATRGAVVLFDVSALGGRSLNQIADYATMRALVPTSGVNDANGPADTILTLFTDDLAPKNLTVFDRNYLKAYYSGAATLNPRQIYSRIGVKVVDAEEGEEELGR